jgi:hypothetical protein
MVDTLKRCRAEVCCCLAHVWGWEEKAWISAAFDCGFETRLKDQRGGTSLAADAADNDTSGIQAGRRFLVGVYPCLPHIPVATKPSDKQPSKSCPPKPLLVALAGMWMHPSGPLPLRLPRSKLSHTTSQILINPNANGTMSQAGGCVQGCLHHCAYHVPSPAMQLPKS